MPVPVQNPNDLLDEKQVAAMLGTATKTLAQWRCYRKPGPPFIRIGRLIRYRRRAIEAWLEAQTETVTVES